jgi:hypothetical protein
VLEFLLAFVGYNYIYYRTGLAEAAHFVTICIAVSVLLWEQLAASATTATFCLSKERITGEHDLALLGCDCLCSSLVGYYLLIKQRQGLTCA